MSSRGPGAWAQTALVWVGPGSGAGVAAGGPQLPLIKGKGALPGQTADQLPASPRLSSPVRSLPGQVRWMIPGGGWVPERQAGGQGVLVSPGGRRFCSSS